MPTDLKEKKHKVYSAEEIALLHNCCLCPRLCGVDRFSRKSGYCKSDAGFHISSVCIHKGEEPVISGKKGICNIFFPHCNLQCVYCQNHDISRNHVVIRTGMLSFEEIIGQINSVLEQTENIVGFVSPSHFIPQMMALIRGLLKSGKKPIFVYNSNGYDSLETIQLLNGVIDVYIPDFKYLDADLAYKYSRARNYPEVATLAIKEMYRQKGSSLIVNDDGIAQSGLIIRHLVLPNASDDSVKVLKFIAEEISPRIHISLMAQYFPPLVENLPFEICRPITNNEYQHVLEAFQEFGFYRGWIQDLSSHAGFRPDFTNEMPFGN
jgi:putative pyruvate formate lyase activating enzyme